MRVRGFERVSLGCGGAQLSFTVGKLQEPLLFAQPSRPLDAYHSGAKRAGNYVVRPKNPHIVIQIQRAAAVQQLWKHVQRYHLVMVRDYLGSVNSWATVHREFPIIEEFWAATSGKYRAKRRKRRPPVERFEDTTEYVALAMMLPDDEKWRDHLTI
jgi:hypothetical protein